MSKKAKYRSVTDLSFGQVITELMPVPDFQDRRQVLDAMLVAAHTPLSAWVVDNTLDPDPKNGKQEEITAIIKDGQEKIADISVSVPTTSSFSRIMFDLFLQQTIVPSVQNAARSYPGTRSGQRPTAASGKNPLTQDILPGILEQTSRVRLAQLHMTCLVD